ncbi:hypothetical protein M514_18412 [Trichuris suis]|uniref:Uncharacterized protein n=1 Tax=Trichuris suis TaxID=68888 RepID=A0A085NJ94_9BILA|nr:hypothetical protein M514_18412 [Trichuris suis]
MGERGDVRCSRSHVLCNTVKLPIRITERVRFTEHLSVANRFLDLGLIPESDGSPGQSVAEWYQKLELVCRLRGVEDVACVVRLRLIDGAFAVYLEIPEEGKESAAKVKEALMSAFSADLSAAYDEFTTRQLRAGEAPDMFLAELRRLASLFGGISVDLACAFITGLPESVRHLLKAGLHMEDFNASQVLAQS